MSRLAVIGAGSWGTALAIALAPRFEDVRLWSRQSGRAEEIRAARENRRYLPGFVLPLLVSVSSELAEVVAGADIVLSVLPSAHLRVVFGAVVPHLSPNMKFVSATKGLEDATLLRMSEVLLEVLPPSFADSVAVLSGPTFAKEVAAGEPAAVVIAARHLELAAAIQSAFSTPSLRLYTSTDVTGVELGAALKNVIAIGAGICHGLGLGSNSVAALVTRGLAEITRLAVALGGQPRTLSGLAGLGDLVLTTTGDLSRNRQVGIQLGKGRSLAHILSETNMVAEGIVTAHAAYRLGRQNHVELPIIQRMNGILYEAKDVRQAIRELMDRPLTSE